MTGPELAWTVLATVLATSGALAIGLAGGRLGERRGMVRAVGVLLSLSSARILSWNGTAAAATNSDPEIWKAVGYLLLYAEGPAAGLVNARFWNSQGWRGSLDRLWQLQAVAAIACAASDVWSGTPGSLAEAQRPLLTAAWAVTAGNVVARSVTTDRATRPAAWGLAAVGIALAHDAAEAVAGWGLGLPLTTAATLGLAAAAAAGMIQQTRRAMDETAGQRAAAGIVQRALPDEAPRIGHQKVTGFYSRSKGVSGDIHWFEELPGQRTTILVAEADENGIEAAVTAARITTAADAARGWAGEPARFLEEMNRTLQGRGRTLVRASCGVIDANGRQFAVACAGGEPPVALSRRKRHAVRAGSAGPALGQEAQPAYRATTIHAEHGDQLVLHTSGATRPQNEAGEPFGRTRLDAALADTITVAARDTVRRTKAALAAWTGRAETMPNDQDVTILVASMP